MKRTVFLTAIIIISIRPISDANAMSAINPDETAKCVKVACSSLDTYTEIPHKPNGCNTEACYKSILGAVKLYECDSCPSGIFTAVPVSLPEGICSNTITRTECSSLCPNCNSTNWEDITEPKGYAKRTVATCINSNCEKKLEYRCSAGYYGSSTNGTTGCTACPNGGTSVAGSNTSITSCYLPTGTKFSDTSGSGEYTENCYYKN